MAFDSELTDGVVVLRPFQRGDAPRLISERDAESRRFLGEGSADPRPVASVTVMGRLVGWIDYDDDRVWMTPDQVNIGYGIFPSERGQRFGSRALRLMSEYVSGLKPPLRPTLLIDPSNVASIALAVRAGFIETRQIDGERFFEWSPTQL